MFQAVKEEVWCVHFGTFGDLSALPWIHLHRLCRQATVLRQVGGLIQEVHCVVGVKQTLNLGLERTLTLTNEHSLCRIRTVRTAYMYGDIWHTCIRTV